MAKVITTFGGSGQVGNWNDAANWIGGQVPATGLGLITQDAVENGSFTLPGLMLLGYETVTINGTVHTTNTGSDNSLMVCNGGTVDITPGGMLETDGGLKVGVNAFGSLDAHGSGSTHAPIDSRVAAIGANVNGVGYVTIDDAIWTNAEDLRVGVSGQGHLLVENAGS